MKYINTEITFTNMLRSENGQGIMKAILRSVMPKGLQAEAVRRFNIYAERNNETISK